MTAHFCLVVPTKKKKKKSLKTNNTHGDRNWARRPLGVPGVQTPYYRSWEAAATTEKTYCPLRVFQLAFSFRVIRHSPALVIAILLWVLCKLKGTLARIGQPSANNPHLGETVRCYPSKHERLLVTHSKQKWPTRRETSPRCQKRGPAAFRTSLLTITDLPESPGRASCGKCHWRWPRNSFQDFHNQNLTRGPRQRHPKLTSLSQERQPNDPQLSVPGGGSPRS